MVELGERVKKLETKQDATRKEVTRLEACARRELFCNILEASMRHWHKFCCSAQGQILLGVTLPRR